MVPFRILHLSDLHFGDHNPNLASNLKIRVKNLQPDLVIATGDLVETPKRALLRSALDFLLELQDLCLPAPSDDSERPRLIVVPGNHDVAYLWGSTRIPRISTTVYDGIVKRKRVRSNYYFKPEKVWVYGFDSSRGIRVGANGKVSADELRKFDETYNSLRRQDGADFERAFKIVALHHHPLPIKYDDRRQRWLILTNAAEFLGEMLKHDVDLIIHGHEHIHARAYYGRSLRTGEYEEVPVVSVGAALKTTRGADINRFNLITIESEGEIHIDFFGAERNIFDEKQWDTYVLRSIKKAKEKAFDQWKKGSGYHYKGFTSITNVDKDGDGRRIVECDDLTILDAGAERALRHKVSLPQTTGYIDLPGASPLGRTSLLELHLRIDEAASTPRSVEAIIEYGRRLLKDQRISYKYDWWAVNAFAMNERELRYKYPTGWPPVEFTHIPISDPVEELNVIVKFPDDFSLEYEPVPFVAKLRLVGNTFEWDHEPRIETQLERDKALRYIESIKTATLRVHRPEASYSYGIQWKLPPSPPAPTGTKAGQIEDLLRWLLRIRTNPGVQDKKFVSVFLHTVGNLLREKLIPGCTDSLETSLMVFDPEHRKMVIVGAVWAGVQREEVEWRDYSPVEFNYGEGIGGKVFKTNEPRLYIRLPEEERKSPDFYRYVPGVPLHMVLLAMPIQNPDEESHVYGVINCGSPSASCPLREVGEVGGAVAVEMFRELQSALNKACFQLLTRRSVVDRRA